MSYFVRQPKPYSSTSRKRFSRLDDGDLNVSNRVGMDEMQDTIIRMNSDDESKDKSQSQPSPFKEMSQKSTQNYTGEIRKRFKTNTKPLRCLVIQVMLQIKDHLLSMKAVNFSRYRGQAMEFIALDERPEIKEQTGPMKFYDNLLMQPVSFDERCAEFNRKIKYEKLAMRFDPNKIEQFDIDIAKAKTSFLEHPSVKEIPKEALEDYFNGLIEIQTSQRSHHQQKKNRVKVVQGGKSWMLDLEIPLLYNLKTYYCKQREDCKYFMGRAWIKNVDQNKYHFYYEVADRDVISEHDKICVAQIHEQKISKKRKPKAAIRPFSQPAQRFCPSLERQRGSNLSLAGQQHSQESNNHYFNISVQSAVEHEAIIDSVQNTLRCQQQYYRRKYESSSDPYYTQPPLRTRSMVFGDESYKPKNRMNAQGGKAGQGSNPSLDEKIAAGAGNIDAPEEGELVDRVPDDKSCRSKANMQEQLVNLIMKYGSKGGEKKKDEALDQNTLIFSDEEEAEDEFTKSSGAHKPPQASPDKQTQPKKPRPAQQISLLPSSKSSMKQTPLSQPLAPLGNLGQTPEEGASPGSRSPRANLAGSSSSSDDFFSESMSNSKSRRKLRSGRRLPPLPEQVLEVTGIENPTTHIFSQGLTEKSKKSVHQEEEQEQEEQPEVRSQEQEEEPEDQGLSLLITSLAQDDEVAQEEGGPLLVDGVLPSASAQISGSGLIVTNNQPESLPVPDAGQDLKSQSNLQGSHNHEQEPHPRREKRAIPAVDLLDGPPRKKPLSPQASPESPSQAAPLGSASDPKNYPPEAVTSPLQLMDSRSRINSSLQASPRSSNFSSGSLRSLKEKKVPSSRSSTKQDGAQSKQSPAEAAQKIIHSQLPGRFSSSTVPNNSQRTSSPLSQKHLGQFDKMILQEATQAISKPAQPTAKAGFQPFVPHIPSILEEVRSCSASQSPKKLLPKVRRNVAPPSAQTKKAARAKIQNRPSSPFEESVPVPIFSADKLPNSGGFGSPLQRARRASKNCKKKRVESQQKVQASTQPEVKATTTTAVTRSAARAAREAAATAASTASTGTAAETAPTSETSSSNADTASSRSSIPEKDELSQLQSQLKHGPLANDPTAQSLVPLLEKTSHLVKKRDKKLVMKEQQNLIQKLRRLNSEVYDIDVFAPMYLVVAKYVKMKEVIRDCTELIDEFASAQEIFWNGPIQNPKKKTMSISKLMMTRRKVLEIKSEKDNLERELERITNEELPKFKLTILAKESLMGILKKKFNSQVSV